MATRKTTSTVKDELQEEVEEKGETNVKATEKSQPSELELLKAELAELRKMMGEPSEEKEEPKKLQPNDYISVMSLLPHTLNLSTKGGGQGNIKRFTMFGETKRVLYQDLVDIIESHYNFLKAGYFYILNPEVIREHGLDDIYSDILTKETIEKIISTKSDESFELYKTANPEQKEVIIDLLIEKIFENIDSVNLNIIDRISRDSGVDILEKVEDRKRLVLDKEEEDNK